MTGQPEPPSLVPDEGVCARQSFGGGFSETSRDEQLARELKQGRLTMPPHPVWELPKHLSWGENPFGQRNWLAQLHMLRWLDPLRRQGMKGDQESARLWWHYVSSWLAADHDANRKFAWMDMIDGVRAKALVVGYPLVPSDQRADYLDAVVQHGEWLASPKNRGHSNHELHQLIGLFIISRFLRNSAWEQQAVDELAQLLLEQYDEEGVNAEGALAYHLFNYRWWRGTLAHLKAEGIDLPDTQERLKKARLELVHATRPDGFLETIGDTASTPTRDHDSPELEYVASRGASGRPPEDLMRAYSAGYVFGRSGWGEFERDFDQETFYSVMFGSGIKVHGHDEAGAVTYFAQGRPWLVDPGKYAYIQDDFRRHFLSRTAHNVVILPEEKRRDKATVSLVHQFHSELADDVLLEDDGYEGVSTRRRVVFHRATECLIIIDTVFADRQVRGEQHWQVASGVGVEEIRSGYRLSRGDGDGLRILWGGQMPSHDVYTGEREPLRGWVSPGWMKTEPAPQIVTSHTRNNFRFTTVIGPERRGDLTIVGSTRVPGGIAIRLRQGGSLHELTIGKSGVIAGYPEPETDSVAADVQALRGLLQVAEPDGGVSDWTDARLVAEARASVRLDASAENRNLWGGRLARRLAPSTSTSQLRGSDVVAAALVDVLGHSHAKDLEPMLRRRLPKRLPALAGPGEKVPAGTYHGRFMAGDAESLDALVRGEPSATGASVAGELLMPWVAGQGDGDVLLVRLHGALDRRKQVLPTFVSLSSALDGEHPYLVVQDPSLDLKSDMRLSWYLGSPDVDGHLLLAELVGSVREALGVRKALLVGSSGGGFAALHVAGLLPKSMALAFSPQTSLRAYHRAHANLAARHCLGAPDIAAARGPRISVAARWAAAAHRPKAWIVLNSEDTHHVRHHVEPFEEEVQASELGDLEVERVPLGPGHVAVRPDAMRDWIERAASSFAALD